MQPLQSGTGYTQLLRTRWLPLLRTGLPQLVQPTLCILQWCYLRCTPYNLFWLLRFYMRNYIKSFFFPCRNAWQLWTKHGTQSTSSVHSADSNSVRMASMSATANPTAATTTLKCSRPSAMAATAPSWRITSRHWIRNGILIASSVGWVEDCLWMKICTSFAVYLSRGWERVENSVVALNAWKSPFFYSWCLQIHWNIKKNLWFLKLFVIFTFLGLQESCERQVILRHGRQTCVPNMRGRRWGRINRNTICTQGEI